MEAGSGVVVLCRVTGRVCALPVELVAETLRPLPIEPVAGMPGFVLGLAVIRGAPMPVIDLARLVGAVDPEPPSRFVILRVGERRVALAVEAVIGVRSLSAVVLAKPARLLGEAGGEIVAALGVLDSELLLVLHTARLVPEGVWAALDATAQP
jgi:purine-binding chemotaxis protein CheW